MINIIDKYGISEETFIKVCESSLTASEACMNLNLRFSTFKKIAIRFGCYKPNQGGLGLKKAIQTEDIH